jgi:type I restriction enzyme S subunit
VSIQVPNPDWAKLPLFDRKGWKHVRFDDVVENINETERNLSEAGIERYIGLEHLEPGSLHIRTWGNVADGTTFTRRCRPGQVLFGKRRAYQRKVAVAEFDAVVSGDIYVLAPKNDRLLPRLLPFLCMSERFFQHAVGTSAGSLSPRTNWSSLAGFEFDLPPLEQQRRIAEILWAVDEVEKGFAGFLAKNKEVKIATIDEYVTRALKENQTISLVKGCHRVTDGTHQPPKFTDE